MKHPYLLSLFLLLLLAQTGRVSADGGLSVAPVFQNISFSTETPQSDFLITVTNTTPGALTLRPSVVDFGSLDQSGGVAFLGAANNLERKYGLASWMRLEKDVIFLDAGESEQLLVTIENRESLSPGGHYGAVLFRIGTDGSQGRENVVSVNQSVSMLVFAKKEGGERYDIELKENQMSKNPFLVPTQARLRFQNGGNVHAVPRGRVTITDFFGRTVKKGSINSESGLILPETQRVYVTALQTVAPALFPGFYTMAIAHRYDGKEDFIIEQVTVFLFPWQSVVILLVSGALYGIKRRYNQRKSLKNDKKEENIS